MVRRQKLLDLARQRPTSLKFRELCALVEAVGFRLDRQRGSHHIYWFPGRREVDRLNLQEGESGTAKPYQVRQVLKIIEEYGLEVAE